MEQIEPRKRLILRFNAHPGTTLEKVVQYSNSFGLQILNMENIVKSKAIAHKIVTITGEGADLAKMKEALVRVPAVTVKEK